MTIQDLVWLFFGGVIGALGTYAVAGAAVVLPKLARKLVAGNRAAVVTDPRRG